MVKTVAPVRLVSVKEDEDRSVITVMASPQKFGFWRGVLVLTGSLLFFLGTIGLIFGVVALGSGHGATGLLVGLGCLAAGILIFARLRRRHLAKRGYDITVNAATVTLEGASYALSDIGDVRVTDTRGTILVDGRSLALAKAQADLAQQAMDVRGTELHILYGDGSVRLLAGLSRDAADAAARALVDQMQKAGWSAQL